MITYKKMRLQDAPEDSILLHACNAQGVWGSGIALSLKKLYPKSYLAYNGYCTNFLQANPYYGAVGTALITSREKKHFIGCMITSFGFGGNKDNEDVIIGQTWLALDDFFRQYNYVTNGLHGKPIYCNKFNSGLFAVPWTKTENILAYFAGRYNVEVVICDPTMQD